MKKGDEILKEAQDCEFRRVALVRAGIIRITQESDVPAPEQECVEAAPKQHDRR